MKKIILLVLLLTVLLSACGGGGDGGDVETRTQAEVHFKNGFTGKCDYVTYQPGFVTCNWGEGQQALSYPADEIERVDVGLVK